MLLGHLRQTKQNFSKELTITSFSRTQPLQDQSRTPLTHSPIQQQDAQADVTDINSTLNGFTQNTEAQEDGCLVIGKNINRSSSKKPRLPPGQPSQLRQNWKRNSSIARIRENFRQAMQDKTEPKPILGLPLDITQGYDSRFSPLHEPGAVFNGDYRTASADVSRFRITPQKEEILHSRETKGFRRRSAVKERKMNRGGQSRSYIEAEIEKLHKPSYPFYSSQKALNNDNVGKILKNTPERPPISGFNSLFESRKEKGSISPNLSPNSRVTPGRNDGSVSPFGSEEVPKEGSLMKYFRSQSNRPKSSANYKHIIQAKQAMYESLALEEDSLLKSKRLSLGNYMTMTKTGFRRGTSIGGRRTISCDNTAVNTSAIDNTIIDVNKSIKAPSSIDVFSEKVKKYLEEKEEEELLMQGMDDETFFESFLRKEYSSMMARIEKDKEERVVDNIKSVDVTITPFEIEESKSPRKPQKSKGEEVSPRKGGRRLELSGNPRVSSQDALVVKSVEPDENTPVKDLDELLVYVKNRNTFVEESIKKVDEERDRKKWNGRLIDTVVDKIKEKGGISQQLIRSSYGVSTRFERDIDDIKGVRSNMEEVEREMRFQQISKEKMFNETRSKLEKAKFVAPNRLTNSELDFVRDQFLNKRPEDMHTDKIDDLLKRLKFFAQLSRGVRISFYNCAKYIKEQKGHYIFHQGDVGDLMYIILRGSVSVKVPKRLKDGKCQFVTVASLYDGSHFGELAIMAVKPKPKPKPEAEQKPPIKPKPQENRRSKKALEIKGANQEVKQVEPPKPQENGASILAQQKRSASIQCAEETEMLTMSRDKFQEILLLVMNTDMDMKIRLLQLTPFYNKESNFTLMPVANNMKPMRFKLGQKVINAGDILMNFYIIAKGTCKVIQEIEEEYVYDTTLYQKKLKPFKHKEFIDPDEPEDSSIETNKKKNYNSTPNPMERTFDYGLPKDEGEKSPSKNAGQKFIKHVIFRELIAGDYFGFRPLLRPEADAKYRLLKESKAKLSVVAYSTNVEIFALPRASLLYLPEKVKSMLLDGISKLSDFDDIDIRKFMQEQKDWRKFQNNLVEQTLVNPEHPNLRRPRDMYKAK